MATLGLSASWAATAYNGAAATATVAAAADTYSNNVTAKGFDATFGVGVGGAGHLSPSASSGLTHSARSSAVPTSVVAAETAPSVIRAGELKLPGVPKGATGVPVQTGKGLEYTIPRGTPEIDPRVTSVRIMDPVTTGKYQ